MNTYKRYAAHRTPSIRHGGGGVRTRDSDALARFQNRQEIHQKARASKAFVWKSGWNQKMGPTTTAATINEINKKFWKEQNNDQ